MGNPRCSKVIRANSSPNKTISVSICHCNDNSIICSLVKVHTFCVHENMSMIAVGFADGTVSLMKGNILHDRSIRHVIVHTDTVPVTSECCVLCIMLLL